MHIIHYNLQYESAFFNADMLQPTGHISAVSRLSIVSRHSYYLLLLIDTNYLFQLLIDTTQVVQGVSINSRLGFCFIALIIIILQRLDHMQYLGSEISSYKLLFCSENIKNHIFCKHDSNYGALIYMEQESEEEKIEFQIFSSKVPDVGIQNDRI